MNTLDMCIVNLIDAIKASEEYREYHSSLEEIKQIPGLKARIDEFRNKNYELQTSGEARLDSIERIEAEYAGLREDPFVSRFLAAELAFCRRIQEMNEQIIEAIDFE